MTDAPTPLADDEIEALRDCHSRPASVFPEKHLRDLWRQSGGHWSGPIIETFSIPAERFQAFCMAVEARLLATIDAQQDENARLRQHLAHAHNAWRHDFSKAVAAATDQLFKRLDARTVLRGLRHD